MIFICLMISPENSFGSLELNIENIEILFWHFLLVHMALTSDGICQKLYGFIHSKILLVKFPSTSSSFITHCQNLIFLFFVYYWQFFPILSPSLIKGVFRFIWRFNRFQFLHNTGVEELMGSVTIFLEI